MKYLRAGQKYACGHMAGHRPEIHYMGLNEEETARLVKAGFAVKLGIKVMMCSPECLNARAIDWEVLLGG